MKGNFVLPEATSKTRIQVEVVDLGGDPRNTCRVVRKRGRVGKEANKCVLKGRLLTAVGTWSLIPLNTSGKQCRL